jgi:hypothetical protein
MLTCGGLNANTQARFVSPLSASRSVLTMRSFAVTMFARMAADGSGRMGADVGSTSLDGCIQTLEGGTELHELTATRLCSRHARSKSVGQARRLCRPSLFIVVRCRFYDNEQQCPGLCVVVFRRKNSIYVGNPRR